MLKLITISNFIRSHIPFVIIFFIGLISLIFGILIFGSTSWGDWYYMKVFVPVNVKVQSVLRFSDAPFYLVLGMMFFIILIGHILSVYGKPWRDNLLSWLLFLSSSVILIVSLFYWMWGFNYGRTTIGESYFQNEYITLDTVAFRKRWELQTNRVNLIRKKLILPDSTGKHLTQNYAHRFRQTAAERNFFFDLDTSLQPQCKEFIPAGMLLRLNTAGFYFPLGSESYVDKALHVTQKPFVIAHELAHGYGVTDEGEANFIGYILSQSSGDPLAIYSSALSLWLYMASDGRHLSKTFTKEMWDRLSPEVWSDLQSRRALDERYPEFMPKLRDAVYDSYLAMNKVEGGMESYNRFVKMVLTYETK